MAGLNHTLNIGAESLFATRQGVDTAGHNIANAHTEGFSRQRINLEQRIPSQRRGIVIGNGVFVKNITRAHDRFLEKQINQSNQNLGFSEAKYESMQPMEEIFNPQLNSSVSDELNSFFNSLQDLSNFPEEITVRSSVRENAQNLVSSFRRLDYNLRDYRIELNERIAGETESASGMLEEIANLNLAIKALETPGDREVSDLLDKQDLLLRKLTKLLDINYYRDDQGMAVVRGPAETLLVERGFFAKIIVKKNPEDIGMYDLVIEDGAVHKETIITEVNKQGRLAGLINVRDKVIPGMIHSNNDMAYSFANHFNQIHREGFGLSDYKHTTGRNFFEISDKFDLAAQSIGIHSYINEDLNAISVASTPNAPGDNVIVNKLLKLKEEPLMGDGDATFNDFFANYVGVFGLELVRAEHIKKADEILMDDLRGRREAIAGVSMDEEATNLLKWQSNFTASSKVITTVDEMFETILSMKR